MKIPGTQEHIDKSKMCVPLHCALANAINDVLLEGYFSEVTTGTFYIKTIEYSIIMEVHSGLLSPEAMKFVDDFDEARAKPCVIEVHIPSQFVDAAKNPMEVFYETGAGKKRSLTHDLEFSRKVSEG